MHSEVSISQPHSIGQAAQRRLTIRLTVIALSILVLVGAMVVALGSGSKSIPYDQVIQALRYRDSVQKSV